MIRLSTHMIKRDFLMFMASLGAALLLLAFARPVQAGDVLVRIGILAKRGDQLAMRRWGPTGDYLTRVVDGYRFEVIPLDFSGIRNKVSRAEIDFVLTNTGYYIELESEFGVSRIATLKTLMDGRRLTVFGGVFITRAGRDDINDLGDLRGKTFMAVERQSLGGWWAGLRELREQGLNPEHDFSDLKFGGTHDAVVYAVQQGEVDAGTVRTDTLERMASEKKIKLTDFKVLNRQCDKGSFPFFCSTRLYPEWPWARLRHTSDDLAEKVTIALLEIKSDDPAARAAEIAGWTVPLDYQPAHELFRELHLGPYSDLGKVTVQVVFQQYSRYIAAGAGVLLVLLLGLGWVANLNRRLEKTKLVLDRELEGRLRVEEALSRSYDELESRVQRRTAQLSETNVLLMEENAERRRVEEELKRQKDFNEKIVQTASVLILAIDHNCLVTQFNDHAERVTGYQRSEAIGRNWIELCIPFAEQEVQSRIFEDIYSGVDIPPVYENNIVCKNGSRRTVSWQNSLLRDDDDRILGILAIGVDITERILAEEKSRLQHEQLIQADKMVALGTLVAGVAHEINNPTTSIMMNAPYVAKMWYGASPILEKNYEEQGDFMIGNWPYSQVRERLPLLLDGITDGARRVKRIVADLKDYARHEGATGAVPVNVNRVVERALSLLSNLIKKSTRNFSVVLAQNLPEVLAQSQRLEQVVINLVINACQALPDPGRGVFVSTFAPSHSGRVFFTVRDEGVGLAEEHLPRVTDPFFTTKRETGGTGLGLAICARIVEDCGGELHFESREGAGTLVSVALPAIKPKTEKPIED